MGASEKCAEFLERFKEGTDEGEVCNRYGCTGILFYAEVEGCTCFLAPPCWRCTENPLRCPECDWVEKRS